MNNYENKIIFTKNSLFFKIVKETEKSFFIKQFHFNTYFYGLTPNGPKNKKIYQFKNKLTKNTFRHSKQSILKDFKIFEFVDHDRFFDGEGQIIPELNIDNVFNGLYRGECLTYYEF